MYSYSFLWGLVPSFHSWIPLETLSVCTCKISRNVGLRQGQPILGRLFCTFPHKNPQEPNHKIGKDWQSRSLNHPPLPHLSNTRGLQHLTLCVSSVLRLKYNLYMSLLCIKVSRPWNATLCTKYPFPEDKEGHSANSCVCSIWFCAFPLSCDPGTVHYSVYRIKFIVRTSSWSGMLHWTRPIPLIEGTLHHI